MRNEVANSHWEVIEQYLISGGESFELTEHQKQMYERWVHIDERLKSAKFRRFEIINEVSVRFNVSKETAKRDMVGCEMVFSSSYPLNKKYQIGVRINFLERMINLAAASNDFKSVEGLEKTLAKYYEMYPDSFQRRSPKKLVYKLTQTIINNNTVESVEDAELIIDEELSKSDDGE